MVRYKDISKGVCHLGPPANWRPCDPNEYCHAWAPKEIERKEEKKPCAECDGNGTYYVDHEGLRFPIHTHHTEGLTEHTCAACKGTGEAYSRVDQKCGARNPILPRR